MVVVVVVTAEKNPKIILRNAAKLTVLGRIKIRHPLRLHRIDRRGNAIYTVVMLTFTVKNSNINIYVYTSVAESANLKINHLPL